MSKNNNSSQWISLSDMMTGLMLVFLLIAVALMLQTKEAEQRYIEKKQQIHKDLVGVFREEISEDLIQVTPELTVRIPNTDLLFEKGSAQLRVEAKDFLNDFTPKYLRVVNQYVNSDNILNSDISEVKIEGHASQERGHSTSFFMQNIRLSQERSNSVLEFILSHESFNGLPLKDQEALRYMLTTNGMGYNRQVDNNHNLVIDSKKQQDLNNSRRVEFKIVTSNRDLVKDISQ